MNEKSYKLLEFDVIRQRVAELALSDEAAALILSDEPVRSSEETGKLKSLVSSIHERMIVLGGESRESFPDVAQILSKINVEGTVLELEEAYALGIFLSRGETLRQWLTKPFHPENDESNDIARALLGEAVGAIPDCTFISVEIFKVIDREGKMRDLPEFREIGRRIKSLQKEIASIGSRFSGNDEKRHMLQSGVPSQRDGRMVLAVKANFRGRIKGIVHEISSSGQTIFVEPEEAVELNNDLLIENRRLQAEIRRVLRELTGRIAQHYDELKAFHSRVIVLETYRARARYGFEHKNVFARDTEAPGSQRTLNLIKAKHPLLGRHAVPLDVHMEGKIRTVIITGPNTGGKTVALKTLGLLAMMNQFGLALPAEEGTLLPVFDGIYADIGDEQSISQSLSTFSAHMTNIAGIITSSTESSLVLLDELGSGTDPEEGSAIAMAILDHFIEKKAHLVITTHHGILKNYGYTREGVENASMEFDIKTLSPTFKIVMGIPGESRAVEIAARNGFPGDLVRNARGYLDEERSDVSALITGLKEKHRELDVAAEAGKKEEKRLIEERRKADLKELRLRQKELQLRSDGVGSLKTLLGESRKTLENLVREVKEGELDREKTLKVKEFLAGLEAKVIAEQDNLEKEKLDYSLDRRRLLEDDLPPLDKQKTGKDGNLQIAPGADVLAGENKSKGRVLRLDKKGTDTQPASWIVEVGSVKLSFSESDLVPIASRNTSSKSNTSWAADLAPSSPAHLEINLLGLRLNEALNTLNRQIDAAVLQGLNQFAVIHGMGDGILSKGVHDFLKKERRVADYYFSRPEAGGFGRTEVVLKSGLK